MYAEAIDLILKTDKRMVKEKLLKAMTANEKSELLKELKLELLEAKNNGNAPFGESAFTR